MEVPASSKSRLIPRQFPTGPIGPLKAAPSDGDVCGENTTPVATPAPVQALVNLNCFSKSKG